MKKYIISFAIVALALCACNRVEMHDEIADSATTVYQLDMRLGFSPRTRAVSFGDDGEKITSKFQETDCIYVYNETKDAFARTMIDETHAPLTALHPKNVSGSLCDLSGSLSFYVWDDNLGDFGEWKVISVDDDDTYSLFYQMNLPSEGSSMTPLFDYSYQDGSTAAASSLDFAVATGITMAKTASTLTAPDGVVLHNIQSMFRLRLSYTDGGAAVSPAPSISGLTVSTKKGTLVYRYKPTEMGDEYDMDVIHLDTPVVISDDKDIFLSLAFHYDSNPSATDEELILTASDGIDTYKGTISVPDGGFVNSIYYYGDLTLAKIVEEPSFSVTRTDGGSLPTPSYGRYCFDDEGTPIQVTISGDCDGISFEFAGDAEVTLSGNGAARFDWDDEVFLYANGNLTVILDSDFSITCPNYDPAIESKKILKLMTTGAEHTLTVTTNDEEGVFGICGRKNYDNCYYPDLSDLETDGFTINRSDVTENGDETFTWTYTVTPNS